MGLARKTNLLMVGLALVTLCHVAIFVSTASTGEPERLSGSTSVSATAAKRVPWKSSRVVGSPSPPAPLREEVAYPNIQFKNPVVITGAPKSNRWFVGELNGRILSFPKRRDVETSDLFLDLKQLIPPVETPSPFVDNSEVKEIEALYGLTFHPQFQQNRFVYVCYVVGGPEGTRISRFKVTETDPPRAIPESEEVIISWLAGGHNGGCLAFGPDGYLYISSGDGAGPNPPDARNSGQDVSNLLSAILRIDVDHPTPENNLRYSIPSDNPFVGLVGARSEIWCYGLRNPWKMKFDRETGDLWVGDVGWELWELVYKVQRGGNYGWSIVEGRQSVYPERKLGPTPILPPTIEISHTDGVSVTGGYVYRGSKFPELIGSYIYGDWETRRIWASKWDDATNSMSPMREVVESGVRLVDFAEDEAGELFLLDYDTGSVHELVRNPGLAANAEFPTKLSETGLFESVQNQVPAEGVHRFQINTPQWADHATAEWFVGVPSIETIRMRSNQENIPGSMFASSMTFPKQTVLAKTLSLKLNSDDPASERRIETQLLHYDGRFWRGYTFAWNNQQSDADLVEAQGREVNYTIVDPSAPEGRRDQTWHFSSRIECARCHNQWTEYGLAFNLRQLNCDVSSNNHSVPQLSVLTQIGLIDTDHGDVLQTSSPDETKKITDMLPRFVNPSDEKADLSARARSWLHVNCAHCHRIHGGGSVTLELREELPLNDLKAVDVRPTQGMFDIEEARILAPGNPFRSTLFYRISKTGPGRMPHVGSELIDQRGVQLIGEWIQKIPFDATKQIPFDAPDLVSKLRELDDRSVEANQELNVESRRAGLAQVIANERQAKAFRDAGKKEPPKDPAVVNTSDLEKGLILDQTQSKEQITQCAKDRQTTIATLLSSTSSALLLSRTLTTTELPPQVRAEVIDTAASRPEPQVRDLFEQFLPVGRRVKRLGSSIRADQLLSLKGDAVRGRELFLNTAGIACKNCHRIGEVGSKMGPELSFIAKKFSKSQLLESILEPSKVIEPKFISYVVETNDGKVHSGLMFDRNDREIALRTSKDEILRIPFESVAEIIPQRQSIMPELLLKDMTAEQVADLLEFLATLK
ncbi:MAG: PQQ-dependent sugar dehydrogenase [Planctomycetales bacterium]|nr:PQQ-dependent sugar dehydrogenase [Planctomycetales bacterium]